MLELACDVSSTLNSPWLKRESNGMGLWVLGSSLNVDKKRKKIFTFQKESSNLTKLPFIIPDS